MPTRRLQRGLSLIESLVSFAVAAVGMMALVATESHLRLSGDLTRQRAEAVRMAHAELERQRAFASVDELQAAAQPPDTPANTGANVRFALERSLSAAATALISDVKVQWRDRQGQAEQVKLHGIVAGLDPALSGYLVTRQPGSTGHLPHGRSLAVPPQAIDLGDGHSAYTPAGAAGITWIFDNRSGVVSSVCSLPPATASALDGDHCLAAQGLVVSGYVRFATGPAISPADAEHPGSAALDLDLRLGTPDGSTTCFDDAPTGSSLSFHCLVTLSPGRSQWSGRLDVVPVGWALGTEAQQYRVCRYSADQHGRDGIGNAEHPLDYREVSTPLLNQNFLVIRGDNTCPADPQRAAIVDRNTLEQAPHPQATPAG